METREALSLTPLPGTLDLGVPPSESPVKAAGALALEVDQDIALEEAALAALDQTLREPEPSSTAAQPLPPRPGELDLGDILELPPLAPTPSGPSPAPKTSAEVPELDLSDLEGLDLGEALGLTPSTSPAAGAGGGAELDLSDLLDLDLDLSVLSAPEVGSKPEAGSESESEAGAGAEYGAADAGLELHLSKPSVETPPSWSLPSERTGVESETGLAPDFDQEPEIWDEVGIKLDLARAYLQMDDPEASRGILREILVEGTEEQIAQAKALLARLE